MYQVLKESALPDARAAIRSGRYAAHTAGLGKGFLQANLAIMPEGFALDFMRFCQRNPKPCPLVGVSDTGNPRLFTMGRDIDIRTDVPAYNIYRDGQFDRSVTDITDIWQDDFVVFALGCLGSSFKCNTRNPQGIGCCDGQTKQAPQQRGTWRDFRRA